MKKILFAIIFSIFLISSASAIWEVAQFDKDFQDNNGNHYAYGHYKVKDYLGLPLISKDIAEYTLIYNTDKCNVGNECKAIGTATLYEDASLFESVDFVDKDGLSKELESYQWYTSNHTEEKQQLVCESEENCYLENYTEDVWDEYNYEILPAGDYKWKLSGYKKENILIDWIATANSVTLIEWADWDVGTWTDLSTTDAGNWVGTSTVQSIANTGNLVYTGIDDGLFGVYNSTSNVWTNLSATDTGNWVGTNTVYGIAVNPNDNLVYTVLSLGNFGVYNRTSNVWTNLSTTDAGDWAGTYSMMSVAVNSNDNLVYTGGANGKLGVYNRTSNVWTDLSATNAGDWVGTSIIYDVAVNLNGSLVYTGIQNGKFGVYTFGSSLIVVQSYPIDYYNFSSTTVELSCNFTSIFQNITSVNVIVWNASNNIIYGNTTSLNTQSYSSNWTTSALVDGVYTWRCSGFGSAGINGTSSNRTFTLLPTHFLGTRIPPELPIDFTVLSIT